MVIVTLWLLSWSFSICRTNAHQIVGAPQVQFREVLRPVHLFDDGWDEAYRIAELNSGFIQSWIINAEAQSPIFLFNKK